MPSRELHVISQLGFEFVHQAKIRELNKTEQYREETNLDKDAVAAVLGTDNRCFVRGMGGGISKTELLASAVPREQLRQQVLKTIVVEDRVRTFEVTVETLMAGSTRHMFVI
ncbi:hypothetical protein C5167_031036 [Papaver somniferum]|nr:hypothetical protein C5167_031036 [Papaver somniferum]